MDTDLLSEEGGADLPCDGGEDAEAQDDGGEFDVFDEGDDGRGPSEDELRQAWDDAKDACRLLERNARSPASVVEAARRQRDRAEAEWRAAKQPHPLHKRLRWAQRAYDAAATKQQAHQEELEQFEEEVAGRRQFFLERARVDSERTARKLRALEDLMGQGDLRPVQSARDAARTAATGIADDLGPALAALADKIPEDSPAWSELQAAMATLALVEDVLRGAGARDEQATVQAPSPTVFDISGGPTEAAPTERDTGDDGARSTAVTPPEGSTTTANRTAGGRATSASGGAAAAPPIPPRWKGPSAGSNRWGGHCMETQRARRRCSSGNGPCPDGKGACGGPPRGAAGKARGGPCQRAGRSGGGQAAGG